MFHYSIPVHIVLFHQGKDVYYSTPVHICIISPRRRCLLFHPGTHLYCFTKGEMFIILSRSMIFVVPPKGTSLLFPPGFDTNLIASNTMYIEFSQTRRLSLSPLHKTRRQEMRKRRKKRNKTSGLKQGQACKPRISDVSPGVQEAGFIASSYLCGQLTEIQCIPRCIRATLTLSVT